jgi:hypothetical protein
MLTKDGYYRKLAALNRQIAEGRERIKLQEARVIRTEQRESHGESVWLLRNLEWSLQLLVQSRAMIVEQLMRWPNYR